MGKRGSVPKKPYSNSFRSLQAIWEVLRRYASRESPLTVREIYGHLKDIESDPDMRPSLDTLERIFPQGRDLMGRLFLARVLEEGEPPPAESWLGEDGLHISVETPDGRVLAREGLTVQAFREPFQAPLLLYSGQNALPGYPLRPGHLPPPPALCGPGPGEAGAEADDPL